MKKILITGIQTAAGGFSERYYLEGYGDRAFLRMNSNSYLGLALHRQVIASEARAAEQFGTGPGAVRFISGTYHPHVELEKALAAFHGRASAMVMSAAYATVMGVLPQLVTASTLVVSDALNHNSIITAIRLSQPAARAVYAHADMQALNTLLDTNKGKVKRVCVVTDGVFSMRGDYAPLHDLIALCQYHEPAYAEGIITIVDDSHGVGALGYETIMNDHPGHPIVPLLIRDTEKTAALVEHFFAHNILVTGLTYPVVPTGEEEIRLQVSAMQTENDIDYVVETLKHFQ
jgi:glycine C-acetyltransferase